MKTGQLFWGFLFLTLGTLFFLVNYDLIFIDWSIIWDIWPLLLIFWGLSIIAKETKIKPVLSVLFGVLVAFLIYGTIHNFFGNFDIYCDDNYTGDEINTYVEDYDPAIEEASLLVKGGVGTFRIQDPTSSLFRGISSGVFSDYSYRIFGSSNHRRIELSQDEYEINPFREKIENRLDIKLNKAPDWNIDLRIGAAKAYFDLSPYKVTKLTYKTGATKTKIKLGARSEKAEVNIEMGAAALEILVPREVGCKLTGDMVLVSKKINGFIKKDSGYYITENFERVDKKIIIDIEGGVSTLKVERY